ncbi:MAG: heat-inducible transcription repressor HrcA [Clostridia bacterium]|nr:heat-inducible transcription repressor HrcA [Clostridia bacterium]
MDLNDRKRKILQAIIDEYIGTAEPVGSRAISKVKELGLSSATIRNEMADLEEMGYLIQPHTSAGRVPSDEGYRFYVNSLMSRYRLGMEAIENLHLELEKRVNQLDKLIKKAGMITSALTEYTTFVTSPEQSLAKISKIDIVDLGSGRTLVIVVTQDGLVRNCMLSLSLGNDNSERLAAILTSKLSGLSVDEIDFEKIREIEAVIASSMTLSPKSLVNILNFVYETISDLSATEIYVDNVKSILKFPEYRDVAKASEIFGFLENKENLKKLIASGGDGKNINVVIGDENTAEPLKDCSLVTVNYSLDNRTRGKIGVIGPKRMDYAKVFASLDLISTHIDRILNLYHDDSS